MEALNRSDEPMKIHNVFFVFSFIQSDRWRTTTDIHRSFIISSNRTRLVFFFFQIWLISSSNAKAVELLFRSLISTLDFSRVDRHHRLFSSVLLVLIWVRNRKNYSLTIYGKTAKANDKFEQWCVSSAVVPSRRETIEYRSVYFRLLFSSSSSSLTFFLFFRQWLESCEIVNFGKIIKYENILTNLIEWTFI